MTSLTILLTICLLLQGPHFRPLVDPIILGKLETFPKGLSIRCQVKTFTGLYNVSFLSNFRDFSLYKDSSVFLYPVQVILFEIDCAIFYTNLHDLFCQFISWANWVNSAKFMDNCWISCQVVADMKKVYVDLTIINL